MYATGSKDLTGLGRIGYTWRPNKTFDKIDLSVSGAHFNTREGIDSLGEKEQLNLRYAWYQRDGRTDQYQRRKYPEKNRSLAE